MDEPTKAKDPQHLPEARVERSKARWLYWIIPICAAAFTGFLVWRDLIASGPTITIRFRDADGVEPENTVVRYRGTEVGKVKTVELSSDHEFVNVKVKLNKSARSLAREE